MLSWAVVRADGPYPFRDLELDLVVYGREMTGIPMDNAWRTYLRVLADTGLDVASVGAWVAAAELPAARCRAACFGFTS